MHEGVSDDSTSSRSSRQGSDAGSEDGTPIISSGPFNIKDKLYSAIGKSLLGTDNYEAFKRSKVKYSMEVHYMDANPYVDFNGGGDSGSGKPSLTLNMGWPITKASSSPANNMLVKLPFSTPEEQDRIELELPTLSLASAPIYTLTFPLSVAMTPSSQLSGNRFVVDYYHSKKLYSSSADIEPDFIGVWQFNNKGGK